MEEQNVYIYLSACKHKVWSCVVHFSFTFSLSFFKLASFPFEQRLHRCPDMIKRTVGVRNIAHYQLPGVCQGV
jgi:hypothetical protein